MSQNVRFLIALFLVLILGLSLYASMMAVPAQATPMAVTIIVDSVLDSNAADGVCTLREAIIASNNNTSQNECIHDGSAGVDTIEFAIGASGSQQTIIPQSALPALTEPIIIDGWSQGGAGYTGPPLIEIDGSDIASTTRGLDLRGGDSIVRGLVINNFTCDGIRLYDGDSNWVYASYIGTDLTGTSAQPNGTVGNCNGFAVRDTLNPSGNNIIGTNGDGLNDNLEGNLISGNTYSGLFIDTAGNKISGNKIGTDVSGTITLSNGQSGIQLNSGAMNNIIGTDGDGISDNLEGNLISGNVQYGVSIFNDSDQNVIAGNKIGTDVAGTGDLGNSFTGVYINASSDNRIGTDGDRVSDALERNIIAGNADNGIYITGEGSDKNVVAGNYIGVDITGAVVIANNGTGVRVGYGDNNRIGTDGDGVNDYLEGNIISGNGDSISAYQYNSGISLYTSANGTIIAGNVIGSDTNGTLDLGNYGYGIFIQQNSDGIIGTNGDGASDYLEGNLISGNRVGIYETSSNPPSSNYLIAGNLIGTQSDGVSPLGNTDEGIRMDLNVHSYLIRDNSIAYNGDDGVYLPSTNAISITLTKNEIFSNGDLGIDLQSSGGVTANDPGDADTGANGLQNFPDLTVVTNPNGTTIITGTLNSTANTTFTLEFFGVLSCDGSGHGEGQAYLGSDTVTTDGSGDVSFVSVVFRAAPQNGFVTATATDPGGNTSEFSSCAGPAISNNDPVADAGPDQLVLEDDFVTLFGRDSYDPDLGPLDFGWTQTGGPVVNLSNPSAADPTFHAPIGGGVLTFTLVVTDNLAKVSLPDEVVVSVNASPVADAGPDQDVAYEEMVTLDGSASYDPVGSLLEYRWTQSGGPAVMWMDPFNQAATFMAPSEMAVLTFTLQVTNTLGLSHSDDVVVTVHQAPAADAGHDQTVPFNATVSLNGNASYDPDGETPLTYQWVQTGGTPVTLSDPTSPTPEFVAPGLVDDLSFTLTVTDSYGLTSVEDEVIVNVRFFIFAPIIVRSGS
jgi:parallel beta-helix repeat protein